MLEWVVEINRFTGAENDLMRNDANRYVCRIAHHLVPIKSFDVDNDGSGGEVITDTWVCEPDLDPVFCKIHRYWQTLPGLPAGVVRLAKRQERVRDPLGLELLYHRVDGEALHMPGFCVGAAESGELQEPGTVTDVGILAVVESDKMAPTCSGLGTDSGIRPELGIYPDLISTFFGAVKILQEIFGVGDQIDVLGGDNSIERRALLGDHLVGIFAMVDSFPNHFGKGFTLLLVAATVSDCRSMVRLVQDISLGHRTAGEAVAFYVGVDVHERTPWLWLVVGGDLSVPFIYGPFIDECEIASRSFSIIIRSIIYSYTFICRIFTNSFR